MVGINIIMANNCISIIDVYITAIIDIYVHVITTNVGIITISSVSFISSICLFVICFVSGVSIGVRLASGCIGNASIS